MPPVTFARGAVAGVGVTLVVAALVTLAPPAGGQALFTPGQDPLAGARVFGARGCVKCHAVRGVGGGIGPDLARTARPRSFFDLASSLWNHAPRMAERMRQVAVARPRLDAREAGDLAAYLYTLDYFDAPGDVEAGRQLFAGKRCIVCHQVGGVGGVVGPNLDAMRHHASPIHLAAAMWNHGPRMTEAMKAMGVARPVFKETELIDLIAYIGAAAPGPVEGPLHVLPGSPERGRRLFASKMCAACHTAGGGGGSAPDLAERARGRSLTQFAAAMWNKAPVMTEAMRRRALTVPQVAPDEMADLVAYLYAVGYLGPGGNARRGAALAGVKGCLGCHATRDLERAAPASPAGVLAALWNHSFLEAPPAAGRPRWVEIGSGEMADLAAYLLSPRRDR